MKNILSIIALTFVLSLAIQAQDQPVVDQSTNKNAPVITFTELTHDYGTVVKEGDGTCQFTFKNTGKEPLILSNVRASCGCTVPDWSKEPVAKGKTGTINVKYNTVIVGNFQKSITVYSNSSNNPIVLTIKGVVTEAAAAPAAGTSN